MPFTGATSDQDMSPSRCGCRPYTCPPGATMKPKRSPRPNRLPFAWQVSLDQACFHVLHWQCPCRTQMFISKPICFKTSSKMRCLYCQFKNQNNWFTSQYFTYIILRIYYFLISIVNSYIGYFLLTCMAFIVYLKRPLKTLKMIDYFLLVCCLI